jgi:hypothetical protein
MIANLTQAPVFEFDSASYGSVVSDQRGILNLPTLSFGFRAKYKDNVMMERGGPIAHVEVLRERDTGGYLATSFLAGANTPNGDGFGRGISEIAARTNAISGALRTLAYRDLQGTALAELYGFTEDQSFQGMAASPGFFATAARKEARLGALERFALMHWWEGQLSHEIIDDAALSENLVQIHLPCRQVAFVSFRTDPQSNLRSYGCGAGSNASEAIGRAQWARRCHQKQVEDWAAIHPDLDLGLMVTRGVSEKRAVFFASKSGQGLFDERLKTPAWKRPAALRAVFDGLLPGRWDRWTNLWRTSFEAPSSDHLDDRSDYFYWL